MAESTVCISELYTLLVPKMCTYVTCTYVDMRACMAGLIGSNVFLYRVLLHSWILKMLLW